jgi:hypothetical protein
MELRSSSPSLDLVQLHDSGSEHPAGSSLSFTDTNEVRSVPGEERKTFRARLTGLLETFDIPDARKDIPMREFLKWRMQVISVLHYYLGSAQPYSTEFLITAEREVDSCVSARLVIAGEAILEALLNDLDEGFCFALTRADNCFRSLTQSYSSWS